LLLNESKIITYSECVFVALIIPHAVRVRHSAICGLPCCTRFFFPLYLINGKIFGKRFTENKMFVLILCAKFVLKR